MSVALAQTAADSRPAASSDEAAILAVIEPVRRCDEAPTISFGDAPAPVGQTPEGYNIWRGTASFGDVVLPYRDAGRAGGVRREFRPLREVLSKTALETMRSKVVTNDHPPELLDPTNTKKHFEGVVHDVWRDGDKMRVELYSMSKSLDDAIRAGKVELSPGYDTDVVMRAGRAPDGAPYDAVQTNVKYNHLSLVDRARSVKPNGEVARLTKDSADMGDDKKKTDDKGPVRTDGAEGEERADRLSEEAMALMERMPEEDKAKLEEALAAHYAEEEGGERAVAEEEREDMPMGEERLDMPRLAAMIEEVVDRKLGRSRTDSAASAKTDSKLDADSIIALAREAANEAARTTVVSATAEIDAVRRVTMDCGCYVDGNVAASKLAYVKHITPHAGAQAEAALKAGRFDALDTLFESAQHRVKYNEEHQDGISRGLARRLADQAKAMASGGQIEIPAGAPV